MKLDEVEAQRNYYFRTAVRYDEMHGTGDIAHMLALHILAGYIRFYNISSILDVGAGTGRAMFWLQQRFPRLTIKGVEPVEALRNEGFAKSISNRDLLRGDVYALDFPDDHFDMVCEFAVLHHVRQTATCNIRDVTRSGTHGLHFRLQLCRPRKCAVTLDQSCHILRRPLATG